MSRRNCPACQSNGVYASHRRGILERGPLTWFGIFPYRCGQCQTRFYRSTGRSFRRPAAVQASLSPYPPRSARWPIRLPADIQLFSPQDRNAKLAGTTENVSLYGVQVRLPVIVDVGSQIEVWMQGEESHVGGVRWHRPQGGAGVLHGVQFTAPFNRRTRYAWPFRHLVWRQRLRRLWFTLVGLVVMAGAAYGLVWMLEALRVYDPKYYEPKDIERQWHELQRGLPEPQRVRR